MAGKTCQESVIPGSLEFRKLYSMALLVGLASSLEAQLQTSLIIASGMVVQRHHEIPVWGTAAAGSSVYATLNGMTDSTVTSSSGEWTITLPAMNEGGPYEMVIHAGPDTLRYSDIYAGDVWLASGQSNMAFELKESDQAAPEIAGANYQEIRQFLVSKTLGYQPVDHLPPGSSWTPATAGYAGEFSAVAYYFAKHLHTHLNIPIGIINTSFGGTRIESWMSEAMLGFDEGDLVFGEGESYLQPTLAYNTMLHPLTRVPIKGFLWYQGESNMGDRETARMYGGQLKTMILSWRDLWSQGEIPFLWVQIPNTGTEANQGVPGTWDALPLLREAQGSALSLPNTGEAITIDTGEPDIHPKIKEPVGERLSLIARSVAYGDTLVFNGPRYKGHRIREDGKVEVVFDHVGGGLVAREVSDQSLRWFSMENSSGSLYPAHARIDSNRVVVWNDGIPNPKTIRYAWEGNPHNVNFYNEENLPAAPFRFRVIHPGFQIESFRSTRYAIDKGESAVLTWSAFGADEATINHLPVDTAGGWRVWPRSDSTFTLKIRSREQPDLQDSLSLRILVREPDPTIKLSTEGGAWIPPGSEIAIHASVAAPDGGTITMVRFYVNGMRIDSITQPPFSTTWIPQAPGMYEITGIATNHRGVSRVSEAVRKEVHPLDKMKFEAEHATIKGGKWILESDLASGGAYVDLTMDWNLTFDGIGMDKDQESQLTIGYMLNHGSPSIQDLLINDTLWGRLIFEAPGKDSWEKEYAIIALRKGSNSIRIRADWGYMSIDYIILETKVDTLQTLVSQRKGTGALLDQNFPNPFSHSTRIGFTLPQRGSVSLEVLDMSGRLTEVILQQELEGGIHEYLYRADALNHGFYLLKLTFNGEVRVIKMLKFSPEK